MALVSFDIAKTHLHLPLDDTTHDSDVQVKLAQAEAVILDYLKARADPTWDETTVPLMVQAAVLLYLGQLFEHRGDDLSPQNTDAAVWAAIERLLIRSRDPALA